jgi:hypothetical protein
MTKEYRAVPAEEVIGKLPAERRARIKARAKELIAEELGLQELRKSKHLTQEQVAERLGGKQVYVSRLEKRDDMKLSTLREYVKAIGGDLQLVVTFPEGNVRLRAGGNTGRGRRSTVRKRPSATGAGSRSGK